jgi:hypothetical protein
MGDTRTLLTIHKPITKVGVDQRLNVERAITGTAGDRVRLRARVCPHGTSHTPSAALMEPAPATDDDRLCDTTDVSPMAVRLFVLADTVKRRVRATTALSTIMEHSGQYWTTSTATDRY